MQHIPLSHREQLLVALVRPLHRLHEVGAERRNVSCNRPALHMAVLSHIAAPAGQVCPAALTEDVLADVQPPGASLTGTAPGSAGWCSLCRGWAPEAEPAMRLDSPHPYIGFPSVFLRST